MASNVVRMERVEERRRRIEAGSPRFWMATGPAAEGKKLGDPAVYVSATSPRDHSGREVLLDSEVGIRLRYLRVGIDKSRADDQPGHSARRRLVGGPQQRLRREESDRNTDQTWQAPKLEIHWRRSSEGEESGALEEKVELTEEATRKASWPGGLEKVPNEGAMISEVGGMRKSRLPGGTRWRRAGGTGCSEASPVATPAGPGSRRPRRFLIASRGGGRCGARRARSALPELEPHIGDRSSSPARVADGRTGASSQACGSRAGLPVPRLSTFAPLSQSTPSAESEWCSQLCWVFGRVAGSPPSCRVGSGWGSNTLFPPPLRRRPAESVLAKGGTGIQGRCTRSGERLGPCAGATDVRGPEAGQEALGIG